MTSKAERKRRKKRITLPGGEVIEQRQTGRDRSATNQPAEDPRKTAVEARLRLLGWKDTEDLRRASLAPLAGCAVGRAIMANETNQAPDLWNAVQHIRKVWVAHDRAIGAPNRHPQCLRILTPGEVLPDALTSAPIDDRTPEERVRAADAAYMRVQGWLGSAASADRSACIQAVVDDAPLRDWPAVRRALVHVVAGLAGAK